MSEDILRKSLRITSAHQQFCKRAAKRHISTRHQALQRAEWRVMQLSFDRKKTKKQNIFTYQSSGSHGNFLLCTLQLCTAHALQPSLDPPLTVSALALSADQRDASTHTEMHFQCMVFSMCLNPKKSIQVQRYPRRHIEEFNLLHSDR